jgi:hypothetical protein
MSGKIYGVHPETGEYVAPPRVQDALSELLKTLGFATMAEDCLTAEGADIQRYARIVIKNWPEGERKDQIIRSLRTLRLAQ